MLLNNNKCNKCNHSNNRFRFRDLSNKFNKLLQDRLNKLCKYSNHNVSLSLQLSCLLFRMDLNRLLQLFQIQWSLALKIHFHNQFCKERLLMRKNHLILYKLKQLLLLRLFLNQFYKELLFILKKLRIQLLLHNQQLMSFLNLPQHHQQLLQPLFLLNKLPLQLQPQSVHLQSSKLLILE